MRDGGLVGTGIIFGWLLSKSWSAPECRLGFHLPGRDRVMFLVFGLAVVGHGKEPQGPDRDEDDDREW